MCEVCLTKVPCTSRKEVLRFLALSVGRASVGWPVYPCRRVPLSVQALSWVFEHSESRLAARHVLLSIANHAKTDGSGAWPSISTIAHESRLSSREVQRSLRELKQLGELEIRVGAGPRGTNLYRIVGVTSCHPLTEDPRQLVGEGATTTPFRGDQMSPEPSLREPSVNLAPLAPIPLRSIEEIREHVRQEDKKAAERFYTQFPSKRPLAKAQKQELKKRGFL
jgi:hypothetical protein